MKRLTMFATAFAAGWVLGWAAFLAIGAWFAYREADQ